jgi:hypothetical protein
MVGNLIEEAIEFYWGERCPDYEEGCPTCAAWKQYDTLHEMAQKDEEPKDD